MRAYEQEHIYKGVEVAVESPYSYKKRVNCRFRECEMNVGIQQRQRREHFQRTKGDMK